jgi:hypothetical protein
MANEAMEAWKLQFDSALRMIEALSEGAMKMHETQMEAAADTHANAVAAQQSALKAADAAELLRIESKWAMHNFQHAADYWKQLAEVVMETNARMAKCISEQQRAQQRDSAGKA